MGERMGKMSHLPAALLILHKNLPQPNEKIARRSLSGRRVEKNLGIKRAIIRAKVMGERRGVFADDMRNRDLENLDFIVQRLTC